MIHRFDTPGLAQYAYLVASKGHAAVIDPMRDIAPILDFLDAHHLTLTHILETHIHADFASGATALAAATGAALALSGYDRGELYQYAMPHRALHTGDGIPIGDLRLEALHTPGHTPEHLSFLLREDAPHPTAMFSGDFLFAGSLGRPDLLGEDAKHDLARELYRSVHERIAALPGTVRVFPGHGAGSLCGAGMSNAVESTLAAERAGNPLFQLAEPDFLDSILSSAPPMPAYYPRMKRLNASGPAILDTLPGGRAFTPAEIVSLQADSATVLLDIRPAAQFAAAHIPGSINIGAGPSLALWAGWLLDPARDILLIGADDTAQQPSRIALLRVGLDRLAGYLAGGFATWQSASLPIATAQHIAHHDLLPHGLTLDVRNPNEFAAAHIPSATSLPLGELPQRLTGLPRNQPITLVCEAGYRASIAASLLAAAGFGQLSILEGGMEAWNATHNA